jgi:hypothetical protein
MPIAEAEFKLEKELQDWVFGNIQNFLGDCILIPGFRITTPSGKNGIPDGFAFNFNKRSWWIIECELLRHGVWPHIAEQLTRFVVAARNDQTTRQIRDKLFDAILADNKADGIATILGTDSARLLQKIELFVESVSPTIAVFIDETNQDLTDFCDALQVATETFRIKKLNVDGVAEYYSPDHDAPAVTTVPDQSVTTGSTVYDAIEQLGGGELINSKQKCFRLTDGRIVKVQYSKLHERHQAYWYGINPSSYNATKEAGCTNFIFVMGQDGLVDLPINTVDEYIKTAYVTNNSDGSVRHYHVHISPPPDSVLKGYGNASDIDVSAEFSAWN